MTLSAAPGATLFAVSALAGPANAEMPSSGVLHGWSVGLLVAQLVLLAVAFKVFRRGRRARRETEVKIRLLANAESRRKTASAQAPHRPRRLLDGGRRVRRG